LESRRVKSGNAIPVLIHNSTFFVLRFITFYVFLKVGQMRDSCPYQPRQACPLVFPDSTDFYEDILTTPSGIGI
jgi:hypothetical protein